MPITDVLPELALIGGAVVVLLAALSLPQRRQGLCAWLTLVVLALAAAATRHVHDGSLARLTFSGTWALDELTAWCTYIILASTALVATLSPRWFATDARHGEWYTMLLLGALGATLLAGAADLAELLVATLLSSVTAYTLASYHRASRMSAEAGAKIYFLGALAHPLMFIGIVLLYGTAATTRYEGVSRTLVSGADPIVGGAGLALALVGLTFKAGTVPAHPWVPDVAEGSPAPAAAFLTVVPKVGALAAIMRLSSLVVGTSIAWRPALAVLAAVTMTLGNLAALWQEDMRRLLGWSSVSQAGYALMAAVAVGRSDLAAPALQLFLVGYALANLAAFAVVTTLRGRTRLADYAGLGKSRPGAAVALSVALLSLTGIPPLIGFMGKLALFGATLEAGYGWLALLAVANTVLSLFYYLRVIAPMFLQLPKGRVAILGRAPQLVVLLSTAAIVVTGLAAQLWLDGSTAPQYVLLPR